MFVLVEVTLAVAVDVAVAVEEAVTALNSFFLIFILSSHHKQKKYLYKFYI